MALVTRSPIRVTAAPSTAPQEAMAASLQAHIDELVQKNRTSEHTIRRLQQALSDERERGADAVMRLKASVQQEREAWREGCDSLLGAHRIVHLRTRIELDKESLNVRLEREENRRERLNVLHRDYKLTLFQAKESELEAKIGSLEDALEEVTEEHERNTQDYLERIEILEKELHRVDKLRKEAVCRMKERETEFLKLQSEVSTLRGENAALKDSSESSSVKLERTMLQLEGVKTSLAELESANSGLKRTNADLKRQLDRWQNLETKGGTEMEEMRKRRIELEVQVKELQSRVKELEKSEKENIKLLERERVKLEKSQKDHARISEVAEDAQNIAERNQEELDQMEEKLLSAQELIEELQSKKLMKEQARKGKRPAHKGDIPPDDAEHASLGASEREVEKTVSPVLKTRARPRPAYSGKDKVNAGDSAEEQEDEASLPNKSRARGKPSSRNKKTKDVEAVAEDDADESTQNQSKAESSNAARKRKNDTTPPGSDLEQDKEAEEKVDEEAPRKNKGKGKQKIATPDGDSEDDRLPKSKSGKGREKTQATDDESAPKGKGTKGRQKSRDTKEVDSGGPSSSQPKNRKPSSSQGPRIKIVEAKNDDAETQPRKKKKRLFPPSQVETFPWDDLPKVAGIGGLNIPTQLSPVKETDSVPARSVFGKVGSAFGFTS